MDEIIASIARAVIIRAMTIVPADEKLSEDTGRVLARKIAKMPVLIRAVIYISTVVFDGAGLFYAGKCFHLQNLQQRQAMLGRMEGYAWKPLTQFLRFYQKFSLYIYYSLREELKYEHQ